MTFIILHVDLLNENTKQVQAVHTRLGESYRQQSSELGSHGGCKHEKSSELGSHGECTHEKSSELGSHGRCKHQQSQLDILYISTLHGKS